MINRWHRFPRRRPKKEGRYQCVIRYGLGGTIYEPTVVDLYWIIAPDRGGIWVDCRRKNVFDGYKVFMPNRAPIEDNRVWEDNLCERIDVMAFRKIPRLPFLFKRSRKKHHLL